MAGSAGWPRPVPVTVAAFLGSLLAAYTLVYALLLFAVVSQGVSYGVLGAAFLALSGLAATGAVRAFTGRDGRLLTAAGATFTGLTVLGVVLALVGGAAVGVWPLVLVATGVAVVVLLTRPASRAFFAAARGSR